MAAIIGDCKNNGGIYWYLFKTFGATFQPVSNHGTVSDWLSSEEEQVGKMIGTRITEGMINEKVYLKTKQFVLVFRFLHNMAFYLVKKPDS